jgi:hypothetical protein
MVAIIAVAPVFVAVNDGIFPEPLAAKPIAVLEFVQVNEPPAGELAKFVVATEPLLSKVLFAGTVTVGVPGVGAFGFTVIV